MEEPRLIDVYDDFDASELGSAHAYLDSELKFENESGKVTIMEKSDTKFRGVPAVHVRYRKANGSSISETDEMLIYRNPKNLGPILYEVMLRTSPQYYSRDRALYLQVLAGFRFIAVPLGECSND